MHPSPTPLHIPDGFLSFTIALFFWLLSAVFVSVAVKRTQNVLGERQVPLMGMMAAFIFAAQMLNFPIVGGTSGHFLGGALAAIVLGPWAGILVMTAVIALQGLLFQDGGLLAMGANIFNMGILTAIIGYGFYRLGSSRGRTLRLGMAGLGAWLATVSSALLAALQLWLSQTVALTVVVPAMLGWHVLIGLGEALITVAALAFLERVRPGLLDGELQRGQDSRAWGWGGVLAATAFVVLAPLASGNPDGLERVAHDLGFLNRAQAAPFQLLPDYTIPFLGQTPLSTLLAGLIGALAVAGVAILIGRRLQE